MSPYLAILRLIFCSKCNVQLVTILLLIFFYSIYAPDEKPMQVDEDAIVQMFDAIADEDDPYVAGMEGE